MQETQIISEFQIDNKYFLGCINTKELLVVSAIQIETEHYAFFPLAVFKS